MAAIYTDIDIEWAGKDYEVKVDFEVIRKVEQKVNLAALSNRTAIDGAPCLTSLAVIYATLLRSAGVDVKDGDVYESMYGANDDSGMTQQELITASALIIQALSPRPAPVKKKTTTGKAKKK